MQTLQHIPIWVFALLIGLIALGLLQTHTRQVRARRLLSTNVALTIFTLVGVTQQWRPTPWLALTLLTWAGACLQVFWQIHRGSVVRATAQCERAATGAEPLTGSAVKAAVPAQVHDRQRQRRHLQDRTKEERRTNAPVTLGQVRHHSQQGRAQHGGHHGHQTAERTDRAHGLALAFAVGGR